jgi:UDP-4-amino-4-deoxy-L-arabinose-oxoglutarate aminotransferase
MLRRRTTFLPFARPSIDESDIAAVVETLRSGWLTSGPRCAALEDLVSQRLGGATVLAATSGTALLDLVLKARGIGPGDEVITVSMTWVSTPNLIALAGATPVFVDVDRETLLVTAEAIEAAITPRTKLIIPVHFAGAPCDMDPIRAVAGRRGVSLIEDAAHAIGTTLRGEEVGRRGTAIFSLHPIKTITSGEGGLLATDDPLLAERVRLLRFHGLGADAHQREQQGRSPQAEVVAPGAKHNLPDLNAALGLSQLPRLDRFVERRQALVARYHAGLADVPGIRPLGDPPWPHRHTRHLFVVRVEEERAGVDRDAFMHELKQRSIGSGIHFKAVHEQAWYRRTMPQWLGRLPNTEWNSARICSLPLFPEMTDGDVDDVLAAIREIVASAARHGDRAPAVGSGGGRR